MQRPSRFGACKTGRAAKAQTVNKFGIGGGGDRSGWMKQKLLAPFASVLRSGLSLSARFFHNLAESSKMQYNRGCHVAHKIRVSAQGTRSVATSNFWEAERMRRRRHFCPRKTNNWPVHPAAANSLFTSSTDPPPTVSLSYPQEIKSHFFAQFIRKFWPQNWMNKVWFPDIYTGYRLVQVTPF